MTPELRKSLILLRDCSSCVHWREKGQQPLDRMSEPEPAHQGWKRNCSLAKAVVVIVVMSRVSSQKQTRWTLI